jgi:spore photoproduct lyase
MDNAPSYTPKQIFVWHPVAEHPQTLRILSLFPSVPVQFTASQKLTPQQLGGAGFGPSMSLRHAKQILLIGKTNTFVHAFTGRPGQDLYCRPYYKLVPVSNGCPYSCTYCYLAFIYRSYSPWIKINVNYDTMFCQIRRLAGREQSVCLNMGEMLDSLALDHITQLTPQLIPFMAEVPNACLMLLTKSANIAGLLSLKPIHNVVVSWSLNPDYVIRNFEFGTASLDQRLDAAKTCQSRGWRIRFRIDPGILYPDWKQGYADLIQKMLAVTAPENITLGMLRLLPGHKKMAQQAYGSDADALVRMPLTEDAGDEKWRYKTQDRIAFYRFLIDTIRSYNSNVGISLCRETRKVWQTFNTACSLHHCNCISPPPEQLHPNQHSLFE